MSVPSVKLPPCPTFCQTTREQTKECHRQSRFQFLVEQVTLEELNKLLLQTDSKRAAAGNMSQISRASWEFFQWIMRIWQIWHFCKNMYNSFDRKGFLDQRWNFWSNPKIGYYRIVISPRNWPLPEMAKSQFGLPVQTRALELQSPTG